MLTAAILLGIIFLFIFLFSFLHQWGRKKETLERQAKLQGLVTLNQLQLFEEEETRQFLIAIDKVNAKLIYIGYYENKGEVVMIDLREIKSVKVEEVENQPFAEKKEAPAGAGSFVAKVQLVLTGRNGADVTYRLSFYQMLYNAIDEKARMKTRAQYWREVVNNSLQP